MCPPHPCKVAAGHTVIVQCQRVACFLSRFFHCFIWLVQENREGGNSMHHLESIYFGFVNLPLHLSSVLTTCVQSYAAVSLAVSCTFSFRHWSSTFFVRPTLRAVKGAQRSTLSNCQNPCELVSLGSFLEWPSSLTEEHLVLRSSTFTNTS